VPFKTRGRGSCPNKEMLKMKEPPGIYMKTKGRGKLKTEPPGILMKTHELIDNRNEASILLKGNEIVARSSSGVIWNGISCEKMGIPTGCACVPPK
jgi:hypothetical protein